MFEILRLIVDITYGREWHLSHPDVKFASLIEPFEKVVNATQPSKFKTKGNKEMVFKLNKVLYWLKQTQRIWNKRINGFLLCQKSKRCGT